MKFSVRHDGASTLFRWQMTVTDEKQHKYFKNSLRHVIQVHGESKPDRKGELEPKADMAPGKSTTLTEGSLVSWGAAADIW